MNIETLTMALVAAAPALTSIIGIIAAIVKLKDNSKKSYDSIAAKFEEVREEVMNTKEYETLKQELAIAHQENRELKNKINELLTAIDRIHRQKENENEKV